MLASRVVEGAVGLTDNPSARQRWLVAGPEVAALIKDFEDTHQLMGRRHEVIHHDQTASVQNEFRKEVCSLGYVMEELGNPFEEESEDLLVLDSNDIADPSAVEAVKNTEDRPTTVPNIHKGMSCGENKAH